MYNKILNSEITLRQATKVDADEFIELNKQVESRTYFPVTDAYVEMSKGPVYMIEKNGETVGAASYEKKEDGSIYINTLVVDHKYQGQGIGKIALLHILDEVKNASKIWLVTHPENIIAVHFYQSVGFQITVRKENYFGNGEPRLVMTLERNKEK